MTLSVRSCVSSPLTKLSNTLKIKQKSAVLQSEKSNDGDDKDNDDEGDQDDNVVFVVLKKVAVKSFIETNTSQSK